MAAGGPNYLSGFTDYEVTTFRSVFNNVQSQIWFEADVAKYFNYSTDLLRRYSEFTSIIETMVGHGQTDALERLLGGLTISGPRPEEEKPDPAPSHTPPAPLPRDMPAPPPHYTPMMQQRTTIPPAPMLRSSEPTSSTMPVESTTPIGRPTITPRDVYQNLRHTKKMSPVIASSAGTLKELEAFLTIDSNRTSCSISDCNFYSVEGRNAIVFSIKGQFKPNQIFAYEEAGKGLTFTTKRNVHAVDITITHDIIRRIANSFLEDVSRCRP